MNRFRRFLRYMKYKYLLLLRAKGGASMVAAGFAVGLAVEMFTLPTYGCAFFLIFPIVHLLKGNLAAALIGFVFGKVIYIPMAVLNAMVGGWVLPRHFSVHIPFVADWVNHLLLTNLKLIVGGVIDGTALGLLLYFPIRFSINLYKEKRKEKRRQRKLRLEASPAAE